MNSIDQYIPAYLDPTPLASVDTTLIEGLCSVLAGALFTDENISRCLVFFSFYLFVVVLLRPVLFPVFLCVLPPRLLFFFSLLVSLLSEFHRVFFWPSARRGKLGA